jgi:hypothetical protein
VGALVVAWREIKKCSCLHLPGPYFYPQKKLLMLRDYDFQVDESLLAQLAAEEKWPEAFDVLAGPLHEWLYREQDFAAIDTRRAAEQLILSFDYVQMQVGQGGFIQLIQNGYVSLLVTVIESLQKMNISANMIPVLDDVLKVFVLNKEALSKETSVEEFGRLYGEFREFESLEEQFRSLQPALLRETVEYAIQKNVF